MIEVLAQHALDGIVVGAILALPALGLALIWRIQGFPHLAHGSLVTIGAYAAWAGMTRLGLPVPVAVLMSLVVAAAFGVGMHVGGDQDVLLVRQQTGQLVGTGTATGPALDGDG